jgi:phenylacetyl-CoA:acceptor oxidoreductase subunit 2
MKRTSNKTVDHFSPRQQRNWDWRAAANFIAGGSGGALLLCAALLSLAPGDARLAITLGLLLIGSGLTCVWFEIGQPWRALNVYRHFATSWMTREAVVALLVFAVGGLAWISGETTLKLLTGFLGFAFLYSQARILAANKGIPAWRHPRSIPLMISTGLAEGAGFMLAILSMSSAGAGAGLLLGLILLLAVRVILWKQYLVELSADRAPLAAIKVLRSIDRRFIIIGHALPVILVAMQLAGLPGAAVFSFVAGLLVVANGWFLKFTLVRRAAFNQGLALQHLPVRGCGTAGPAVKPGWGSAA